MLVARTAIAYSIVSSFAIQPVFAVNCESQLVNMTPHYENAKQSELAWSGKSEEQKIVTVLSAIGENGLPKINVKSLVKDGKIVLGFKAEGQEPIIAIYKVDASKDESYLQLVELRQKTGGNSDVVISEKPIDNETGELFPSVAAHPNVAAIRKNLLLNLGPEVTKFLSERVQALEFAEAKDFRDIATYQSAAMGLRVLNLRMRSRALREFLGTDVLKQVWRNLFTGVFVASAAYLGQRFATSDQATPKSILDSLAALLLVELANLEVDAKVQIPNSEREWLAHAALQVSNGSHKPSDGETLQLSQIDIAATRGSLLAQGQSVEKFWVLDRPSGRIFVGLAEATYDLKLRTKDQSPPRVELSTRALVEISAKEMPVTYKTAHEKFKRQNSEKVIVK